MGIEMEQAYDNESCGEYRRIRKIKGRVQAGACESSIVR